MLFYILTDEFLTGALSDGSLMDLAKDIERDEHVSSLAARLGFSRVKIDRYLATNSMGGRQTHKGTEDMLFDWRLKTKISHQPVILKKALIDSGLRMLAEHHLKTISIEEGKFQ